MYIIKIVNDGNDTHTSFTFEYKHVLGNMMETYGSITQISNPGLLDILGDYLTPRGENITSVCLESGEIYKKMLAKNYTWAMQMFDADP